MLIGHDWGGIEPLELRAAEFAKSIKAPLAAWINPPKRKVSDPAQQSANTH